MRKRLMTAVAFAWVVGMNAVPASAMCTGTFFDILGKVDYMAMFPLKLGTIPVYSGADSSAACDSAIPDVLVSPICTCVLAPPVGVGINFWWIGRLIETVKDPYCSPTLGMSIMSSGGMLGGGTDDVGAGGHAAGGTFAQAHEFTFPFGTIVGYLLGGACTTSNSDLLATSGLEVQRLTELELWWQDDTTAAFLQPEAFLLANPVASLACIPDKATSLYCGGFDATFWCSWDEVYPMTGHDSNPNQTEANANIAARLWYSGGRTGLLWDHALDPTGCLQQPTPIWVKSHFKWQIASPVPMFDTMPTGKAGMLWDWGKNPLFLGTTDQFIWVLSWKESCCANSAF